MASRERRFRFVRSICTTLIGTAADRNGPVSNDECRLLGRAVEGDTDALGKLLREYGPQVRRRLTIRTAWQGVLDPADVMQVTYTEAFLRIGQFAGRTPETFVAWLTRIAENNLRDAIKEFERAKRPDPRRSVHRQTPEESTITLLEALGCSTATASRHAANREAQQLLEAAVAQLPETYQKVVRLFDLRDQPAAQVAHELGRSTGAVYMLRARAHERLCEILGPESGLFTDCA
jgi:RNA polymerase sigma-70 factor (subfamily 1)